MNARVPRKTVIPEAFLTRLVASPELRFYALAELTALSVALDSPTSAEFHELSAALDGHHVDPNSLGPCAQRLLSLITAGPRERVIRRLLDARVDKETIATILYPPPH